MQRATSFRAGSAWKPTSSENCCCASCGVMPSGRVMSTCVPRRTLSSTSSTCHLPSAFSAKERARISCEWPFSSKSSIRRFRGFRASATERWLFLKAAHTGVQMGSRDFRRSSPFRMRRHISASQGSLRNCSQSSRVAGKAGAPCPLPMQVNVCVSFIGYFRL